MAIITVKRDTTASVFRGQIDNVELHFDSSGTATAVVGKSDHTMTWQVIGKPGDTYKIEIIDPPHTCSGQGTLDGSLHDEGSCDFDL